MNGENIATIYPPGIEYRTPRPRGNLGALLLGGLLGLVATQNAGGAALGGILGAALSHNDPMPLPQAIRLKFAEKHLNVVNFYRHGPLGAKVLFERGGTFATVESRAPNFPVMSPDQIDDWLYGDLTEKQLMAIQV